MRKKRRSEESGWTLIEILVVVAIIATLAGLTTIGVQHAIRENHKVVCQSHVAELMRLLESSGSRYPQHDGPNLLMYLVDKGDLQGDDALESLFCPGDLEETLEQAGGEAGYKGLELNKTGAFGHLTSYAARAQRDKACRAKRGMPRPAVLIADDSEDHHDGRGIIVGLTGGSAKFRDKYDAYELDADKELVVGEGSSVEELRCLRVD